MTKKQLRRLLCWFLLCLTHYSFGQTLHQITGKVTDAVSGAALANVSISVKGTKIRTVSDDNGLYAISVKNNATLVYSFVGYTTKEVNADTQLVLNVTLTEQQEKLDSVVVTALGYRNENG